MSGKSIDGHSLGELVRRANRGETAAKESLCLHLEPTLRRYVDLHMGKAARRWAESADVAQQVLMETMNALEDVRDVDADDELAKRLYQRAKWRILDLVRNHRRDTGESGIPPAEPAPPTSGTVTRADERRLLLELVAGLPPHYRAVVEACALDGLSYAAAAHRLGLRLDTVRKRYERVRRMLQSKVEERRRE